MSNSDFEDRLRRIKATGGQQRPTVSSASGEESGHVTRLIVAVVMVNAGALLIKVANANYDFIRDQYGVPIAAGLGLVGIAMVIFGVLRLIGAIRSARSATGHSFTGTPQSGARASDTQRFRYGRFLLGVLLLTSGVLLIRYTNHDYELIRDQYGLSAAAGLGLGGFVLALAGATIKIRTVLQFRPVSDPTLSVASPTSEPRTQVQTTAGARLFFSLLGLGLGGLACLFMYIGNAGRQMGITGQVNTETANAMAMGSTIAAFLLLGLAFLIGFIGLFVRRLPMRRVPVFFVLGAMVLYTSFQTLRIHPTNWPTFMAEFSRSFTNQIAE
jgi:uncharacterized membrane protein YhaH (DUF805 family)